MGSARAEWQVEQLYQVHALLLAATFTVPRAAAALRRPSLCHDGTPLVYSLELGQAADRRLFRMLVEPGGTAMRVAEQIDWSLHTLDSLLGLLDWRAAAEDVNAITARVFPSEIESLSNWWGGIWLGLAAGPDAIELRLYLNLRHGSAEARWQRVARVLGLFGDDSLGAPLQRLADRVARCAIPVGLGVVVTEGRVPALRLYVGVHQPSPSTLGALVPNEEAQARAALTQACAAFGSLPGVFRAQCVTVGYDFRRDAAGTIMPSVARTKIDFSCQLLAPADRPAVVPHAAALAGAWGFGTEGLRDFTGDLDAGFGGFDMEYVSVGLTDRPSGLTVYAKPHGCTGV